MSPRLTLLATLLGATLAAPSFTIAATGWGPLARYAATSKIEANLSEVAVQLSMLVINEGEFDHYEEFLDDVGDIEHYLDMLDRNADSSRVKAEIATYRTLWTNFANEGKSIAEAAQSGVSSLALLPRLNEWFGSIDDLDAFTDENLELILDSENVVLE